MRLKTIVAIALGIYVIGAGGVFIAGTFFAEEETAAPIVENIPVEEAVPEEATSVDETASEEEVVASENDTPAQTTPEPAAPTCGSGGSCTAQQVANHNTQADCWVIYNGAVYDVSGYVNAHPGGADAFDFSTCGTDIAAQLTGQAGSTSQPKRKQHSSSDLQVLANFYVGALAQ